MCAEINSIEPAGEKYKVQAPPAETLARVAVVNPAFQMAAVGMKPGGTIVQAVMRRRESSRAPLNFTVRDGRACILCAQGSIEDLTPQSRPRHHRGPRLQHVQKVRLGYSGASLGSRRRISKVGRQGGETTDKFTHLMHHLNEFNLRQAFHELDGAKASGIDHVTKEDYGKDLSTNIADLQNKVQPGGWRPKPSHLKLITTLVYVNSLNGSTGEAKNGLMTGKVLCKD